MRKTVTKIVMIMAVVGGLAFVVAPGSSSAKPVYPPVTIHSFTSNFSFMKKLVGLTHAGKGKVEVILPDTVTSARYAAFDAPMLTKAFSYAGLSSSQFKVQNALGSDATQITDAQTAIANGASVILIDPLDSGTGAQVERLAKQAGVTAIDYDRLSLGGSRKYYVSFNNVNVGKLIGQGFVQCMSNWHVRHPKVIVGHGAATDNNATLFAQGYNGVINKYFSSHKWVKEAALAGTWDPPTAATEFEGAYAASKHQANAVLMPNDNTDATVVTYLKNSVHVKPYSYPTTGQDATVVGIQNIISGFQCGTAYKPIYIEAQAAATLALFARASLKPPASFVNDTTKDTNENVNVPSVLLQALWVTPQKVQQTVIKDNFVKASAVCTTAYKADCREYHIH